MLVERIINKIINEKIDIDKLLVVTFTNAAASEMRERILEAIYKRLEDEPENENLQRQINLLGKASICTIDSFCLDVIKNNFYEIEVSPNFRIADSTEVSLLKQEVLEELFENKYEAGDKDFIKLINTYTSYRDDTPLKELILKIYTFIQSSPFPRKWLNEKIEMFNLKDKLEQNFSETPWGKVLLEEVEEELIDDITTLQSVRNNLAKYPELDKYQKVIELDIEQLQILQLNLDSWDKSYELALNLDFKKWPVDKKIDFKEKEDSKAIRDSVRKKLKKKLDKILSFTSIEANQDINDMYITLYNLKNLIFEFDDKFSKKKKEKNILDFSDIEHLALQILVKENDEGKIELTDVAKMYQQKFVEIAIDEYQDSNLVQEYILTSVSVGRNIFMVGDVKQSIYKFRQARPELFMEKYSTYKVKSDKAKDDDLKIQLFKNFRSRENILEFTNLVFENLMSNILGNIEYDKSEFLNLGADYQEINQDFKTEITIIDISKKDEEAEEIQENENDEDNIEIIEQAEIESKYVAKKIQELIKNKFQVYDTKSKSFRNIKYSDIVILLRSTKETANVYEKQLIEFNIPVFSDTSSEYLDSIEIQTVMSILKVIDNPMQDIPLVTVLRSPIFNFSDNDLVEIRLVDKYDNYYNALLKSKLSGSPILREKINQFLAQIDKWRKAKEYLALDELIWKIYVDTGYYNYVILMPNGELRQANLRSLFEKAKQYESASFKGLFNFINFIEKLKLGSKDLDSAKLIGENENVVRIMSIHKSKGLEFPVVFLSGTGKEFNLTDLNKKVLIHQDLGLGVKYIDYDRHIEYDTLSKAALRDKLLTETLSEEMRILYVALTRAKEKLFITGVVKNHEEDMDKMNKLIDMYDRQFGKINPVLIKKYIRYIDWVMLVYLYNEKEIKDIISLNIQKYDEISNVETEKMEKNNTLKILEQEQSKVDKDEYENIKSLLEYEYKFKDAILIPTKMSVTKIKEMKQDVQKGKIVNYIEDDRTEENSTQFAIPKFLSNSDEQVITSAQKGTLMHLCLQKLDEKRDYTLNDIKQLVKDLQLKEIITEEEAKAINCEKIYNFTKSVIWKDLKQAKEVYKEKPFYISLPASEIYNDNADEKIIVQGIIDLYYIDKDDKLVLVDYKTDYIQSNDGNELIEKYSEQLNLYKKALEEALHRKVDKVCIYSIYLNDVFENMS